MSKKVQIIWNEFLEYATDREREILEVLKKEGNFTRTGQLLGVSRQTVQKAWKRVERRAGKKGFAPDYDLIHPVAPGMTSKGTSIRYDQDGNVQQYWNKTTREGVDEADIFKIPDPKKVVKNSYLLDAERKVIQQWISEKPEAIEQEKAWQAYAQELAKDLPRAPLVKAPKVDLVNDDIMSFYPVSDHHLGMLAWRQENAKGDSYDLDIAEEMLCDAMDYLVSSSMVSAVAVIAFMGDFMHYDGFEPVTPTNKHQLDADSRYPKMVRAAIRSMRYLIDAAKTKHDTVHVIVEIGNHDLSSSIFLMECLHNIYEKDPRVTVDTSPQHYHYYRFGKVLLGTHHGHGVKLADLPLVMATDVPEDWGMSEFRTIHTGHVHHNQTHVQKDFRGADVESHRVLAAQDAYANQKGYRSLRDMKCITYHREYGEVSRHQVNPLMLEGIRKAK
jgi:DNA-binding Lrp family transcriptional regulator